MKRGGKPPLILSPQRNPANDHAGISIFDASISQQVNKSTLDQSGVGSWSDDYTVKYFMEFCT